MHSAFGVDHGDLGEVSKVKIPLKFFNRPKRIMRGMPDGRAPSAAQKASAGQGPPKPSAPVRAAGALHRIGEADISLKGIGSGAGKGIKGVGGYMERHPGITGTALVGGGGAAGYKVLSDREPKKKRPR